MREKTSGFMLLAMLILNISAILYSQSIPAISSNRMVDWSNVGLLDTTPIYADYVFNIENYSGNDDDRIATAITLAKNAAGVSVVYFPAGSYYFYLPIELLGDDYSNIIFQGEGSDKTFLNFTLGENGRCFTIHSDDIQGEHLLSDNISKGSKIIEGNWAAPPSGPFANNDWIYLCEYNHPQCSDPGLVGQITRLTSVTSNQAEMKDEASKFYDQNNTLWIKKFVPIQNIGIENMTIKRWDSSPSTSGQYANGTNVKFEYAVNCWVKGVEFDNTARHHVHVSRSSHIEISGCYFHDANSTGGDSYGYGTVLGESSTNCLIENNIFRKLRHAMIIGSGVNCNVFAYNYSREQHWNYSPLQGPDICIHGRYPYGNLFEGNVVDLIFMDTTHGWNGPYNTFLRNRLNNEDEAPLLNADYANFIGNDNIYWATQSYSFFPDKWYDWLKGHQVYTSTGLFDLYFWHYTNPPNWGGSYIAESHEDWTAYRELGGNWMQEVLNSSFLNDISYYRSSPPAFFNEGNYSWPPNGPGYNLEYDSTIYLPGWIIPAEERYNQSKKTYLARPISTLTTSGSIGNDEYWIGNVACTDDVTVPAGITLTIDPGASVTFPDGKGLIVHGTLNAVGASSSPIEFDCSDAGETWYGITFESGSSGELEYCTIRNASYGAYVKQSAPSITHCTFIDNNKAFRVYMGMDMNAPFADNTILDGYYGMYLYDPDPSCTIENCTIDGAVYGVRTHTVDDWTELIGNNIRNCQAEGVRLYKSEPVFYDNNIYSNDDEGIYMYSDSEPSLFESLGGNNVVAYNGTWGIYIASGCWPILGSAYAGDDEGNSYYSNGTGELYSLSSHAVNARKSWWGQAYSDTTLLRINGNFYCSPILSSDPNETLPGLSKSSVADVVEGTSDFLQTTTAVDSTAWRLFAKAHALQVEKKFDEAIPLYQQIIDEHVQTPEAEMAVVRLARCYKKTDSKSQGKQEIIALSASKESDAVAAAAELEAAEWELQDDNINEAIAHYEGVVRAKKSRSQQALYDLWAVHFHITGNKGQQTALLKQYEDWYGEDENVIDMKLAMRLISGKDARKWAQEHADDKELGKGGSALAEAATPREFALHANYPNPFNPTTRIAFDLPEASAVRLEIYNVLGQRAVLLLDDRREAGRHVIVWDGRTASGAKAAAGLYFCRMTAGEFAMTIKMTLLP